MVLYVGYIGYWLNSGVILLNGWEFRKKHKEWKERILKCKLENWVLDLCLSLTGSINLNKSFSLSASVSLPIK